MPLWIEVARLRLDTAVLKVAMTPPPETTAAALGGGEPDQFRFRASGRLWSRDSNVTNDDGFITLTHPGMPTLNTKRVLVEAQGLICVLNRGVVPPGNAGSFTCP